MTDPQFHYYPWVRIGIARLIKELDDPKSANQPARAQIDITAKITTDDQTRSASLALHLFGPSEITGLDERQVIRTDPPTQATDFEPNLFPLIDFYWPSLPWLFTPTAPDASGHLRPWLCLVVVKQEGSTLTFDTGRPLPVLTVNNPGNELPDPNESWAWAYAQITGTADEPRTLLAARSEQTLSRLVCPRRLEGGVAYRACVVPVFSGARKTGLGQPLTSEDEKLAPAWKSDTPGHFELPVYYHWEFSTGPAGDFESLVWELHPRPVPEHAGYHPIAVEKPAEDWSDEEHEQTMLGSALQPPDTTAPADGVSVSFQEELRKILNAHEDWDGAVDLPPGMPLPPPFYARWQAAQQALPEDNSTVGQLGNARWLRRLNLEIGFRAVAGLGARVVQEQQEALMTSAWEQLGEIERANQALQQAQLAMETGRRIYERHLAPLSNADPTAFLALTGSVHSRIIHDGQTVRAEIVASCLPLAATQGAFRRLARPRGPLGRRLGGTGHITSRLVQKLNDSNSPVRTPLRIPGGTVTPASLDLQSICELSPETLLSEPPAEATSYAQRREAFIQTAQQVQQSLMAFCAKPPLACSSLPVETVCTAVLGGLKPWETVPARIGDRLELPAGRALDPTLGPILAHPVFPQPMYRSLVELSQDFLLSGVENIPPDTILLLESNASFIEAFMAGLNDEMGRELLWHGYPTDQRGTYFRRFWDPRSNLSAPEAIVWDITPMHKWEIGDDLGDHRPIETKGVQAVLLIRGRLLQRFPDALIFAAKAKWLEDGSGKRIPLRPDDNSEAEMFPIFQGVLPPDLTFLGFDLSADDMRGDQDQGQNKPGWFIILQQRPTKPRYGLDETRPTVDNGTWEDLSWEDIELTASGHISPAIALKAGFIQPDEGPDKEITWGAGLTSAQLAYMTLQTPVRVAIHASDLLPAE